MNKIAIALMLGTVFAVGCDKKEEASGDKIGIAECDEYFDKVEACMGKMPAEAKGAMEEAKKTFQTTWKEQAKAGGAQKDALKTGCKAAVDALASNPMCK